ncbi:MAG: hypothetical protein LBU27_00785 [Candidatus Peribacteria bacterium]|jgi:hypothetical protein|nr:hypothetical protein [Candidatus Peribacteria bacterium]
MKTIKIVVSLAGLLVLLAGCHKEELEPQSPNLSQTSLTILEGETSSEIVISGGVAPYSLQSLGDNVKVNSVSNTKFTITGLSAGNTTVAIRGTDGGESQLKVSVSADPNKAFKANATIRVEVNGITYTEVDGIFVVDKGGKLLESSQVKIGFSTRDGSTFWYIGWDEDYQNPKLYTPNTPTKSIDLSSLQEVQAKDGKKWIIGRNNSWEFRICTRF